MALYEILEEGATLMEDNGSVVPMDGGAVGMDAAFETQTNTILRGGGSNQLLAEGAEEVPVNAPAVSPTARFTRKPSHPRQYADLPETVRYGSTKQVTFSSNSDDVDAYNTLLERTEPPETPEIIVIKEVTEFYEGVWYTLIQYKELLYQKL